MFETEWMRLPLSLQAARIAEDLQSSPRLGVGSEPTVGRADEDVVEASRHA